MKRTFSYTDDKSNRIWTVETEGSNLIVTSTKKKSFASAAKCIKAAKKMMAEKTKDGYEEEYDDLPEGSAPPQQGPEHAAEVEALLETIASGDYAEAAEDAKVLLQKEGLTGHYRQRVQAQGIALGIILKDQDLIDACTKDIPEHLTSDVLAFNLACLAALHDDKPTMLKYIRWALRAGKVPEQFLTDSDFAKYKGDPEFAAALEGAALPEQITASFYVMENIGPRLEERGDYAKYKLKDGTPFKGKIKLPLRFDAEDLDAEKELPHFLSGSSGIFFSLRLLNAFKSIGIDRFQTFPAVIYDKSGERVWRDYVLVNVLGRDNVRNTEDDDPDGFDFFAFAIKPALDDRKINNSDKFLAVVNPGIEGDWLILSGAAVEELKQYAPEPDGLWGFHSADVMVADHSVIPDPEDLTAEEWRAKCEYYLNKELVKQAAECAQNAVARDEKDHLNWYWLARANTVDLGSRYDGEEEQKALLDKGIELYEKSLALKSDYAPAWIGLSKIYETGHAGRPRYDEEKVVECLCKALEADSKCEEAYSELVGRYNISAESSLGLARKWTENLPENPRAWYEYAKYLDGDENRAERIAAYETILALQRVPLALYQLGREYRSIDLEKSAFYFSQLTIEDKARMYDYMWADMLEAIKELTRKLTPIVKEELVDVRSEEPVFLTIETNGSSLTTTTGILGTAGESETTAFDSEAECQKAAHALYESKLGQYYPVAELRLRLDLEYEQSPEARALEAFYAEQLRKIRSQPEEDLAKLPKAIADPLAVIGALDDEKIVADFKRSILSSVLEFKLKNTTGYTPQAMHFRWYYGGDSKENEAYGSFYEKFDRDGRPLFSGKSDQYDGEMNVGSVMSPLYEVYDELRDNDSVLLPLLQRLFEAKVYLLAEFAYREAEKLMDLPNFLMRRYDNDSVFIAAPRGDAE